MCGDLSREDTLLRMQLEMQSPASVVSFSGCVSLVSRRVFAAATSHIACLLAASGETA